MYFKGLVFRSLIYSTFLSQVGGLWCSVDNRRLEEAKGAAPGLAGGHCLSLGRGGHRAHGETSVRKKPGELATEDSEEMGCLE